MAIVKINEGIITISQEAFEDLLKQFNVKYSVNEDSIEFKTFYEEECERLCKQTQS